MTVKELIEHLKKMPQKATVYMLIDRSDDNYDEDGRAKQVYVVDTIYKETNIDYGWEDNEETNVIIQTEEK